MSLCMSLWSMTSKAVSEDKLFFTREYQAMKLKISKKKCHNHKCVSWQYILRVIYRSSDITLRVFILLLVWVVIGGFELFVLLFIESCVLVYLALKCEDWSVLTWILKTPIEKTAKYSNSAMYVRCVRWISQVLIVIVVWIYTALEVKCKDDFNIHLCQHYRDRSNSIYQNNLLLFLAVFSSICCSVVPLLYAILKSNNAIVETTATTQ